MKLFRVNEDDEVPAIEFTGVPRRIGRGTNNDLVIADDMVSTQHLTIWVEGGRAWIRDHGSRNGTFVNGERVTGPTVVDDGDRIRLGTSSELMALGEIQGPPLSTKTRLIEDIDHELRYPIHTDRFYISRKPSADLRLDDGSEHEAALSFHPDGEIWLATYDEEGPLEIGQAFEIDGRNLRVVEVPAPSAPTKEAVPAERFPYRLVVTLDGVAGAEARVEHKTEQTRHTISAENRAVLLYLLARQVVAGAAENAGEAGTWCADDDVAKGIWGRRGTSDANSLHVLVHRLRKELKKAGFDPWFIEKRRKAIRLALSDVVVT